MPDNEPEAKERTCRHCCQVIASGATVCHHCQRHQDKRWQKFLSIATILPIITMSVTIVMMLIALSQLQEAKKERIMASQAVSQAQDALERVKAAGKEVVRIDEQLQEQFFLVVSMTWLQLQTRGQFGSGSARLNKANQEIMKDINAMLVKVIPDKAKRKQWLENLYKRLPPRQ